MKWLVKKEENTVTSTSFGLRHSLAMLQMAKPLFFILLNQILLRRLANSYVLSIRLLPSVVNVVFKNTLRRFKVTWFRHMGNTLFYCSVLPMGALIILPMGVEELGKKGSATQGSVQKHRST